MISSAPTTEFDRWMTLERIAMSEFAMVLFDGIHDGSWDEQEAMDLAVAALRGFGNGSCYFLASAAAAASGWSIIGFRRPSQDAALIHAAICDPLTNDLLDILGRRPVAEARDELAAAVGALTLSVLPPLIDVIEEDEFELLSFIASGLPWMPNSDVAISRKTWASTLIAYVEARSAQAGMA